MFFRRSSREVVDGSMLILPRASVEQGKDLKWTARRKYHESIMIFRNSSRCAADAPMVIWLRASSEKGKDLERVAQQKWQYGTVIVCYSRGGPSMASWRCHRALLSIEGRVLSEPRSRKNASGRPCVFRHSSREVVDGSMLILPRASLEKGKDLKWTARQKYHESITIFRNSSRRAAPNGNSAARLF